MLFSNPENQSKKSPLLCKKLYSARLLLIWRLSLYALISDDSEPLSLILPFPRLDVDINGPYLLLCSLSDGCWRSSSWACVSLKLRIFLSVEGFLRFCCSPASHVNLGFLLHSRNVIPFELCQLFSISKVLDLSLRLLPKTSCVPSCTLSLHLTSWASLNMKQVHSTLSPCASLAFAWPLFNTFTWVSSWCTPCTHIFPPWSSTAGTSKVCVSFVHRIDASVLLATPAQAYLS